MMVAIRSTSDYLPVVWLQRWRIWSIQQMTSRKAVVGLLILLLPAILWRRRKIPRCGVALKARNPFEDLYKHDTTKQCQETTYQPFLVGCPESCDSFRPELKNETFYRLTLEWYLGQPRLMNHLPLPVEGKYYEKGYNYESCSADFAHEFGKASDKLESTMSNQFPDLNVKAQEGMHVSLAYFCCLKLEEAHHVRHIMRSFVKEQSFRIPAITFERIECWKERFNSITHIIVVDNPSQKRLLKLLDALVGRIENVGIPITVSRLTQMPFHATLLGTFFGDKYSTSPEHDISRTMVTAVDALQNINKSWKESCFDIQHDPQFSARPIQHTQLQ